MLELLEQQKRLTTNQKKIVAAAVIGDMLDYFDFGLIGFALAFIVGPWKLTYGQSAMILLTSGIAPPPSGSEAPMMLYIIAGSNFTQPASDRWLADTDGG
jgi:hypothetical protein